jgi:membrane fusion protein
LHGFLTKFRHIMPTESLVANRSNRLRAFMIDNNPLFREEAIEGLRSRYGRPVPLFGIASWVLVIFMFATLAAILTFLATTNFARKETVSGILQTVTGTATITYSRPSRITEVYVREGQIVEKGKQLMRLSLDTALDRAGRTLGSELAASYTRQAAEMESELVAARSSAKAQREELLARSKGIQDEIANLSESLAVQQRRLELEQDTVAGLESLRERGFVSEFRIRERQSQLLNVRQGILETRRQLDRVRTEKLEMYTRAAQLEANSERTLAQLRSGLAVLDERNARADSERTAILVAPYAGRVVTLRATLGAPVEPGVPLATILPNNTPLEAVLWVPSRAIGFVRPGNDVRLMYDAFPFQRFGTGKGKVRSISSTPVDARELGIEELLQEGALYRVKVRLDSQSVKAYGKSWALAPGSRLRADLVLERQTLLDKVLEPLQAFRNRTL